VTLTTSPAAAELSARDSIDKYRKNDPQISLFLNGLLQGFEWANSFLHTANRPEIFCEPEKLALTVNQEVDILNRYIEENPTYSNYPVGAVLLQALRDAFPCSKR
jgi:hypothetical protein